MKLANKQSNETKPGVECESGCTALNEKERARKERGLCAQEVE